MKKIIFIFIILFCAIDLFAQTSAQVYDIKGNSVVKATRRAFLANIDSITNHRTILDAYTVIMDTFGSGDQIDTIALSGVDTTDYFFFTWTSDPGAPADWWVTSITDTIFINCGAAVTSTPTYKLLRKIP